MIHDPHGRAIRYLRLSITPACSMRCVYCRPAVEDTPPAPERLLSPRDMQRLVRHLVNEHGLRKVRITGGEPTTRPDLLEIVERLAKVCGLADLAMTTNGLTLCRDASRLMDAGLHRVNVSLDSLDRKRFADLTGVDGLARVLEGIDAAIAVGLSPVKLNTVVVRGDNDQDLPSLLRFAADRGLELRLIELMPMGPLAGRWAERYVPESEMWRRLSCVVRLREPLEHRHDAARRYRVVLDDGRKAILGFVTPMSHRFCDTCDRIRIAADGSLYPCLMDEPAGTVLPALRPTFNPDALDAALTAGLARKQAEHPERGFVVMTHLGG